MRTFDKDLQINLKLTIKNNGQMKNLKSILAAILLISLISCKKNELKPYEPTGEVTYSVKCSDSLSKLEPKHISYGYENVIKDTVVIGDFQITIKVPACNNYGETKKIFLSCKTENPCNVAVDFRQTLEFANNKLNFSLSSAGTCSANKRIISDYFYINAE